MKKYIIREVSPDSSDLSFYFDDDGLTSASGDYFNNLFIVSGNGGFNLEEYNRVKEQAENLIDSFDDIGTWNNYSSYKEAMQYCGIKYNSHKCHLLKEWAKDADINDPEDIAMFLTITTGKTWASEYVSGYCQGDYAEIVYCPEHYKNGVKNYGEVWLGCGKEFCVIELDENGKEIESCYGYIVADSEAWNDDQYKKILCEWAGISEQEAQLEMVDGSQTVTTYNYRIA